jgi:hypothetical protein
LVSRTRTAGSCVGASCGGSCTYPSCADLHQSITLQPCCDKAWLYRLTHSFGGSASASASASASTSWSQALYWLYTEWSAWSASCGPSTRTRTPLACSQPSCASLCGTPSSSDMTQTRSSPVCCPSTIDWIYSKWSSWSATCGSATRSRTVVSCAGDVCGVRCSASPVLKESVSTCCPSNGVWTYFGKSLQSNT